MNLPAAGKGRLASSRPGVKGKLARPLRRPASYENTIEGNLKQLIDDQDLLDASKEMAAESSPESVDAPLIRLVNSLVQEAIKLNASDIHIEPFEGTLRVRFRIDGVLQEIQKIPHKLGPSIISRLKIMAGLDICEKRIPQDGTIHIRNEGAEADLRVSTLPSVYGEKTALRILGRTNVANDLSKLGIPEKQLSQIRDSINKPDGLILVTGPTGSGKTTTLYACLNELNDISVSVFTAEDPVEGDLPGVTQCQVNSAIGYSFATILRSLLRQDPDVILVGEIRDQETAEISIKAALTGHLVLSTLHTNCAASSISRLVNMGVAPYLLTSSINCIIAQRLVRRICTKCKQVANIPPEALEKLGSGARILENRQVWHGSGCPECRKSGYKGRIALYEVLTPSDELRRMILAGASKDELKDYARQEGMTTLREAGLELVRDGITTLEEVLSTTNEDPEIGLVRKAKPQVFQAMPPNQTTIIAEQPIIPAAVQAPALESPVAAAPQACALQEEADAQPLPAGERAEPLQGSALDSETPGNNSAVLTGPARWRSLRAAKV